MRVRVTLAPGAGAALAAAVPLLLLIPVSEIGALGLAQPVAASDQARAGDCRIGVSPRADGFRGLPPLMEPV